MDKKTYLENRAKLLNEAQDLINAGDFSAFEEKKKEIEKLDSDFDNSATAKANLEALKDKTAAAGFANQAISNIEGGTVVDKLDPTNSLEGSNKYDTDEYKNAFMKNVLTGSAIPPKFSNADANTTTSDVGSVIPTTTMQKIVEKMESIGMILPLVTRTSYKGGLAIPTSTVKPVATWVAEGGTSDKQKKTTGTITFSYYKLRCAISMSLEVSVTTYPMFEALFIQNVADAMVKTQEQAIISGDGSGKPKGILAETPNSGQALTASTLTYELLLDAESALPQAYEAGAVYCMTKKTFNEYLKMKDADGQPIARVTRGISGKPERDLLGRTVILCGDYMDSFSASLAVGKKFAFLFSFKDYVLNTNQNVTVKRYTDNDTEDEIMKAVALVDGKVVDKNSLVTIAKKA